MASGDESEVVSERETQFVYQSGDEDVLWAVQEITAERNNKYKVKWVGVDPSTAKPWPQSWVLKHDCTDDLVVAWKKRKKLALEKKRGRRTSTASRASGASMRTGSTTTTTTTGKTRRSTSTPPPSKSSTIKRKRQSEVSGTATTSRGGGRGGGDVQDEERGESSRPRKKQKTMVVVASDEEENASRKKQKSKADVVLPPVEEDEAEEDVSQRRKQAVVDLLLPPISSDDESDSLVVPKAREKVTQKSEVTMKNDAVHVPDGEESSPPKSKLKSERRSDARKLVASGSRSDVHEESRLVQPKTKTKVVPQHKERAANIDIISVESDGDDVELRPPTSKKNSVPKDKLPSKQTDDLSEKRTEFPVHPIKIGPPRGVKRQAKHKLGVPSKPGPSRLKPRKDDANDERVPVTAPPGRLDQGESFFGSPLSLPLQRNKVDNHTTPRRISTPQVSPSRRSRSPLLSPGAKARLQLFDRMMAEPDVAPAPDVPEDAPDAIHFNFDDIHDDNPFEILDFPPPCSSPPQPKLKRSKPRTPNGLIVPETESSGNSQSQSQPQPLLMPPPPLPSQPSPARDPFPRKPGDLPAIAVIAASAAPSSTSPQDTIPPQKPPPPTNHPPKKRLLNIPPGINRFTTNAPQRVVDSDPPPSSIESFTSSKRADKGKQKAVENDQLESGISEREGDVGPQNKGMEQRVTDSELRKRGKALFDQAQMAREAERQKNRKPRRLKAVNEIVNGIASSPPKASAQPFASEAENALDLRWDDVVDLSGGANSATLDTQEHSERQPLSEEQRERLRIELRQEEEESTQEAMGIYPSPPAKESIVVECDDAQMPPPRSPKSSSIGGQIEEVDHVEQPSTDLVQASVIVEASQGQRHEDVDVEPSPANQAASSPARPIPENLTDSPKRRLGEALSLLNVKSEEIQRLERELADERKHQHTLKTELAELRASSEPTGPVRAAWDAERAQWTQERAKWEKDFSTWETQRRDMSDEKAGLSARLVELSDAETRAEEAKVKISELEAERAAWTKERDGMLSEIAQRSEEFAAHTKVRGEDDEERSRWEAERSSWVEEKAKWETERAALQEKQETLSRSVDELTASVESMRAARDSADKDREFFRKQYQQASTFVGSVRDENVELEKRVEIAEGQAQEGVAAIKALFEGRVKALQGDIDRWKGLTELLQEKDRRTNDELRLRAAQVPELIELCGRRNAENKSLEAEVRKLGQAQQRNVHQRNRLLYEILLLKKERVSLRSKLSKLAKVKAKVKASGISASTQETSAPAPPTIGDLDNIDPNDIETLPDPTPQSADTTFDEPALFPCKWRPEWRDQCQQIFDTKEDLERHMQEHYRDLPGQ